MSGAVPYVATAAAFLGIVVALLGLLPRWQGIGWVLFAVAALLAYLGLFDLPDWVLDATVFRAVGDNVLGDGASTLGVTVVAVLALALLAAGWLGFTRLDIPKG